jgi:hypothetical protein
VRSKLTVLLSIAVLALLTAPALADNVVSATVTPGVVSVSVNPTNVDYGVLTLSESDLTRTTKLSSDVGATFTATAGTLPIDLFITGAHATATGEPNWSLISSPSDIGAVAINQYVHRVDEGATFNSSQAFALSTSPIALAADVPASGSKQFVLQMNMPTTGSNANGVRSTTVTLTATACGC